MLKEIVSFVAKYLKPTNIPRKHVVQYLVGDPCLGRKVKSIEPAGKADVYCLVVPATHNFIANGMVVHNSIDALRYAVYTHCFAKEGARLSASDLDKLYFEAHGSTQIFAAPYRDPETQYIF